jgi:hypothetical protein
LHTLRGRFGKLQVNVLSSITSNHKPAQRIRNWLKLFASLSLAVFAVISFRSGKTSAQNFPALVGRIEGDDLEVVTETPTGVETNAAPTVVASGSDVTLRSGHALLLLNSGGSISVCGPAHFKLVKSAGAVTLALDYGRVHPTLESSDIFTIYTPTIIATPIAIAGATRDLTVGLDQGGEMCVLTAQGAMRVEPQFSDQSLIVPQGGTVTMSGGQIDSLRGDPAACACDFPRASMELEKPVPPAREIAVINRPREPEPKKPGTVTPPPAPKEEPVYTVLMPALNFDASSPTPPPDPDPQTIVLVREVRSRSSAVFRGHVNPAPVQASLAPPAVVPARAAEDRPAEPAPGFLDRVRNFFRRLAGKAPCAGAGCSG